MDDAAIEEMFESIGAVTIRRLFGGKGIYSGGMIIALEFEGGLLLKGDDETAPVLEAAGAQRWGYQSRSGKLTYMPYWSMPESAYDDPDDMAKWVRLARDAAERHEAKMTRKPSAKKGKGGTGKG
ncbi:DNA transformation protein [Rhizobium sp. RU20A]|uniref:TfoX/Sxy family protein n=1 Tax=Rhizobium sp. RU20A TaxID=1907412 RepID=UPI0009571BCD|nr:TfoX/Sxy family protein [Rhizobium sp. RU20A]SIQ07297.1 DNA transformation protein [Rhizobium sp. RU20A]